MSLEEIKNKFPEVWLASRRAFPASNDSELVLIINFAYEMFDQKLFFTEDNGEDLSPTTGICA